jgi:hypothetical protein
MLPRGFTALKVPRQRTQSEYDRRSGLNSGILYWTFICVGMVTSREADCLSSPMSVSCASHLMSLILPGDGQVVKKACLTHILSRERRDEGD